MANKGKSDARGFYVNPIEVKCSKCGSKQYIKPNSGDWDCFACDNRHRG